MGKRTGIGIFYKNMKNIAIICLALFLTLVTVGSGAQTTARLAEKTNGQTKELIARVVAQIEQHVEAGRAPGAALVVVAQGAIAHAQGFGYAVLPDQVVTPETIFSLGSVSKNYVGLAINRLAAAGKLQLDAEVGNYLPELKIDNPFDTALTIRHLLNHSSGFSTFTGNRNQREVALKDTALADSLSSLAAHRLQAEPGTRFEYSNANYQILGVIIERLTGQSFPAAMDTLVFDPLQLQHTQIGHDFSQAESAAGYRYWLTTPRAYRQGLGSALEPQGGVSSNALDMGRYLIALTGGNATVPGIYDAAWADTHPTDQPDVGYGPGWSVRKRSTGPLFYHHGLNPGFSAVLAFDPVSGLGVGVAANASDGFVAGDVTFLMESVVAEVFPDLPKAQAVDHNAQWLGLFGLFALLGGILLWVIWFLRNGPVRSRSIARVLLPSVGLLGLAALLGIWLPPVLQIPLGGAAMFSPDIGWTLLLLLGLSATWGVVRLVLIWRPKTSVSVD